ncbi:MAG: DUF1214 domain-containing protein [Acidimicrobiales bacterium]|nr:DUF1214 domain-containing protein [Acidimicrobiales bacterium]
MARPRGSKTTEDSQQFSALPDLGPLDSPEQFIAAITDSWTRLARHLWDDLPVDHPVIEAHGFRFLLRYLVSGASMVMEADPAFPRFVRFADSTCSWGINNPDGNYLYAAFDPTATYRISGDPGSAHLFDIELHGPCFTAAPHYDKVGNLKRSDLVLEPDGSVVITLSPHEHPGNWLPSTPDTGEQSMLVRQFFLDWETERPASLQIERLDAPYPPPPLDPMVVRDRTDALRRWLVQAGEFWHRMLVMGFFEPNAMFFMTDTVSEWGGHQGQAYGEGNFRLEPGEAAILEIDRPDCDYWMVQLADRFWDSMDFDRRQTSLNEHQMVLDDDDTLRAVISIDDPGVPNWLDTAGQPMGTIMGRVVNTVDRIEPRIRVVPLAELRAHLPADTPVVTPEERSDTLRRRHVAAQRRLGPTA